MAVIEITTSAGQYWTEDFESPEAMKDHLNSGLSVTVWWYARNGMAYKETGIFENEDVRMIMTDRDAVVPMPRNYRTPEF